MVTSRFLLPSDTVELSLFSLFSSFLKRLTTGRALSFSSSFFAAEGPVQMTEGRECESVLLVGLLVSRDTEYSDPALVVGEGLVVSVIKVGDVVDTATWGDTGLEAIAAS